MPTPLFFNRFRNRQIVILAALILLVLACFPSVRYKCKSGAVWFFTLPAKVYGQVTLYFYDKKRLVLENRLLRGKVAELTLKFHQSEDILDENKRLRALEAFKERHNFTAISAEIVARDPNDWMGSVIINKGEKDGLSTETAVCSSKGLLGKIVEVWENESMVLLLANPDFKAGGVTLAGRVSGVVTGAGSAHAKMLYIPMDENVNVGATVVTSKLSRIFPEGIIIGKISGIGKDSTGLFKVADIDLAADLTGEEEVLCVSKQPDKEAQTAPETKSAS
ncbi:MAG: rod shape-determining protein MreC [Candidatus Omnitrophica bacterium]|nr:rod shape-determining protein MreC [Candidatus Omnitrophota bacterium]